MARIQDLPPLLPTDMPDPLGELQLRDPWFPSPPDHRRTHGHAPPIAPPRSGLPMGARSAPLFA
eukprot:1835852-Heterocapsa_arctica.AAC.1